MTTGAAEGVAGTLPRVPDAPLPAVAPPVSVPLVGSSAPHTADPVVCGLLGGIIILNWVIACCCAGVGAAGAGAAAGENAAGNDGAAEAGEATGTIAAALFACVECLASICSIIALVYAAFTGLFRAWLGGQAVSGWRLAMAIISTLQLLACVCICCCASCVASIPSTSSAPTCTTWSTSTSPTAPTPSRRATCQSSAARRARQRRRRKRRWHQRQHRRASDVAARPYACQPGNVER